MEARLRKPLILLLTVSFLVSAVSIGIAYEQEKQFRIIVGAANVRFEPTTKSQVVAVVELGTVLKVLGETDGWIKVSLPAQGGLEKTGYIWAKLGELEELEFGVAATEGSSIIEEPTEPEQAEMVQEQPSMLAEELGKPAGFNEWTAQLEAAREKRGKGKKYAMGGGGVILVGSLLPLLSEGSGRASLLLTLGGAGLTLYGIFIIGEANEEIEDLDREGRIKGYLTMAPTERGVGVVLNLTF